MSKIILAIIVIIVLVIVLLGLYLVFLAPAQNASTTTSNNNQTANATMFEIQGMKIEILKQGSGSAAKTGDMVTVNYVGTLADGKKFDSSIDRNSPFIFGLGQGKVIKGWDLGVVGMKVGEKRKLTIPADLAYGPNGFPPIIPKNATLTFEVDMLKIN